MRLAVAWTLLVSFLLGSAAPGSAVGNDSSHTPVAAVVEDAAEARYDLGLDRVVEQRFRLFGERDGERVADATSLSAGGDPDGEPVLTAALVYSPEERPIPDDLRINLKPRTWGDLSGWEKLGVVVSYAGSVAGAAYLVSRVVD
jgi:hypothetical protein